jgi:hypothetical protein
MRDCVFFVADKTMRETFFGFLGREDRDDLLGGVAFQFDPGEDLFFAAGQNDPGLWTRANELLRPFQATHQKAVVAIDCAWEGSPGPAAILERINQQLQDSGWDANRFVVIAINPELEQWIWQDSPVLEKELRHSGPASLRLHLAERGLWPAHQAKPPNPKEVFLQVQQENRAKKSSAVFKRIAAAVPITTCADPEFQRLVAQLQVWFPAEIRA